MMTKRPKGNIFFAIWSVKRLNQPIKSPEKVGIPRDGVENVESRPYKQGFCTDAEVLIMDEDIEMMPINQTNSKPQFPWWVMRIQPPQRSNSQSS